MQNNFEILVEKVNGFIRKYYKNLILKGAIYSVSAIIVLFLLIDMIEYFAWSSTLFRTVLFYSFITITSFLLVFYILIPGVKILKIGKVLSPEEAAKIIGEHFPEVKDKLLNTLQLKKNIEGQKDNEQLSLLLASIEQKSSALKPIPFSNAVDMKKNIRHLRYFLPPLFVLLIILFISPAFVTEPSERLINHRTFFEKPLPYKLVLENEKLEVLQRDDFILKVKAEGEELPATVYLDDGYFQYKLIETKPGEYEHLFVGVAADSYFQIKTEDYKSQQYHLKVLPKPVIFSFEIELDYPDYLNVENETVVNSGDLVVPEGTNINWKIFTRDAEKVLFKKENALQYLDTEKENVFSYSEKAKSSFFYSMSASNEFVPFSDSMSFSVQVIPDEYPAITIEETSSEFIYDLTYIKGSISDDHGFYSFDFYYRNENKKEVWQNETIKIDKAIEKQFFNYSFNNSQYNLLPGESLEYFFEVRDNDAVNGFKRTKSASYFLRLPSEDEIEKSVNETSVQLKDEMNKTLKELEELNKKLAEAQLSLFQKKELNWMEKAQIQELFNQELELQKSIEQLNEYKDHLKQMNEMVEKNTDPELQNKMQQLQELFEKMENKDLEKQLEELKKSLENIDKDKINDMLEKMKKDNEQLSDQLDQNLELYKQFEFEQKMQELIDDLQKLAEQQKELGTKTENKETAKEESLKEQEKIKESFLEIEKEMKEADAMNDALEEPFDVDMDTTASEEINQEMDEASENLEKGKESKAGQNQKSAGQKMEKMAGDMSAMMQSAMQSRMGEDAEQTKKLLDNIMDLSFAQENLMSKFSETFVNDPANKQLTVVQKSLQDDFVIIEDSLAALSKRQVFIQPFILKESASVESYMQRAVTSMQEIKKGNALAEQQYAITSLNNLALMLEESLEQMQQSMQSSGEMKGKQQCPNPGNAPGSMSQMMQMQGQLNKGMNKKSQEKGLSGSEGLNGQSEELARMAAMQSEIRKMLQNYLDELESSGGNGDALNKLIEEMKKSEDEIVNRKVTEQTLERQKDIEVRLLKSDKAQQEREKENRRESSEGKNRIRSNQNPDLEYNELTNGQEEILISSPVIMSQFYKELYQKYLYKIEKENGAP